MIRKKSELTPEIRVGMKGGAGQIEITELVSKAEMLDHARLYARMYIEPGAGIGYHEHSGETEIFNVIEGSVTWSDGTTDTVVSEGDVMICEDGKGHEIRNTSGAPARLTALIILK